MHPVEINLEGWQLLLGLAAFCLPPLTGLVLVFLEHRGRKVFITRDECSVCHRQTTDDLAAGDDAFQSLRSRDGVLMETLIAMGFAIISICNETGANCGDLPHLMARLGRKVG